MAHALGRSPETISSEHSRNAVAEGVYASLPAQALSQTRCVEARAASKLYPDHVLERAVLTMLGGRQLS